MKHKLLKLEKQTNFNHENLYIATYDLGTNKPLYYEFATRRKDGFLSCQTGNHTKADGVKILPVTIINGVLHFVFIKEFRHPLNDYAYSLPAGLIEENEPAQEAAIRELGEEIGATVTELTPLLPTSYVSMGFCDESLQYFEAEVVLDKKQKMDDNEDIEIVLVPVEDLKDFLDTHVVDASTRLMSMHHVLKRKVAELEKQIKNLKS